MATIKQNSMIVFYLSAVPLILMELKLEQAMAKSEVLDVQSWFWSQRRLLESNPRETPSATPPGIVAMEMIPRHHPSSPFYRPDLTRAERVSDSVRRSRARAMSMSRRLSDMTFASPGIFYQDGDYSSSVLLGTPPQKFDVILDTGSDLPWVQCKGCNPCSNQSDSYFDRDASSTYATAKCDDILCNDNNLENVSCDTQNTCLYHVHYLAGEQTHGTLSLETLTLFNSNGTAVPQDSFYFGCGLNETTYGTTGTFRDVDGILGIGPGPLSLVGQLGSAIDYKFSYCLQSDSNTNVTNRTSTLLLGSEGSLPLNYTALAPASVLRGNYYVEPRGISVGGVELNLFYPNVTFTHGMIMDSGHPLTLLAEGVYLPLLQELRKQITYKVADGTPHGLDLCYNTSTVDTVNFPAVAFTLGNLTLTPDPNVNIFQAMDDDDGIYCLTVAVGNISILGNIWQQNYQIAYDLKNFRVGFAATTCGM